MKRTADVLIPVYHPGNELEQLLSLLEAQDYPVNRIILMNTEEACFPAEILKDHPKAEVHHVTRAEFDHGGTRSGNPHVRRRCGDLHDAGCHSGG